MGAVRILLMAALAVAASSTVLAADVKIGLQYGLNYLPMLVMKHERMVEAEATRLGAGAVETSYRQLGGGTASNEALIAGDIDVGAYGVPPMIRLWQATQGSANPALAIEANSALGLYLVSSDEKVRSVADFGPNDRIALPAVKVSAQALTLQMAAAAAFGKERYAALDALTVSMPHGDAAAALLSKKLGITAHFGQSPFIDQELAAPGFHTVLSTFDVFGPDATNEVLVTTTRFRTDRRPLYDAVVAAHRAAMRLIMSDKKRAAEIYVAETNAKLAPEAIEKILSKPLSNYTPVPRGTMRFATFMHETGQIKHAPASWRDLFFPEIHDADGS